MRPLNNATNKGLTGVNNFVIVDEAESNKIPTGKLTNYKQVANTVKSINYSVKYPRCQKISGMMEYISSILDMRIMLL